MRTFGPNQLIAGRLVKTDHSRLMIVINAFIIQSAKIPNDDGQREICLEPMIAARKMIRCLEVDDDDQG